MNVTRRRILSYGMAAGWPVLAAPYISRAAEAYPARRVTIINQFAPGSISDAAARLIAQSLQDQMGQPFIVENKVGAGGLVAATAALVFISAYGGHEFKWKEVVILYVILITLSVLVFVKGLTLPFPLWPAAFS